MSLRDRGTQKWVSLMLPEHVRELKRSLNDGKKIAKPILDEQQIEMLEEVVIDALDRDDPLLFSLYDDGFIRAIKGKVTFIDHIQKQFRVKDNSGDTHFIAFGVIINIEKSENP